MDKRKLMRQIGIILLIICIFATLNICMYSLLTSRLANNFANSTQPKMVDVGKYLPFEADSDLPNVNSSLKLSGDLPVLDGAAALVPVYAGVIHNIYPEGCVTYEGGSFSDSNYYGENFAADSAMQYRNTIRGFEALLNGDADVFFCAELSDEQKQYADEQGIELTAVPIGLEAFVFFVNENNAVNNLTAAQIRDIYAGNITNWSQVGGSNRIINPVTRLLGSGSQTAMERFMGDVSIGHKHPLAILGGSIGFSFRYYLSTMVNNSEVKMLSVNGVYPNAKNIQNGSYPIISRFYAVYRTDNLNENIKILIDWLLSDEGQELINLSGYVSIQ